MNIRFFIGPMSKNIVDAILEFTSETGNSIGLIPSRRQVEFDGGYVNNWTTKQFKEYAEKLFLVRDHGGPGQGLQDDDGFESLKQDCELLDMIHLDPWKKYPSLEEGTKWTIEMIRFCLSNNSNVLFEVGTEESIRRFEPHEVDTFLNNLEKNLKPEEYNRIRYCVIQSGTSLKENKNTGQYDSERLKKMIDVVKRHGLLTKEHNGDYLPTNLIKEKFSLGLDSINIAPEFGQIETKTYMKIIKEEHPELLNIYWKICYDSGRWKKWVDEKFNPFEQKEELINICGHYVLSNDKFIQNVKNKLGDINDLIKTNVKIKLKELFYG